MALSDPRYKILPLRGTYVALSAEIANISEGEICYATDEDQYYQKEGGVLVAVGATKAQGSLADTAIQPLDNASLETLTLSSLEKTDPVFTTGGQLGFDDSQGLILYRTQQGAPAGGAMVTVLDGANVLAGDHMSISNLGAGATDASQITFSVVDGAGSGLNADQVDGLHANQFLRSDADDSTTGTITAPKIDTPEIENTGSIAIDANGSGADITLSAGNHVFLESGAEAAGSIYFRGNDGASSYRFAKSGQTSIEGILSFEGLGADRTYTFPNSTGTIALTSSNVDSATTAANCSRSISGGNGLTGGGELTANRTLNVGAGAGISVASDAVSVDSTVVRTTGNRTLAGNMTFDGLVTTNGVLNCRGNLDLTDNVILRFGSGDDCEMFVDGSHMYMDLKGGIGNFYIRDGTTTRFTFDDDGTFIATGNITTGANLNGTLGNQQVRNAIALGSSGSLGTYALLSKVSAGSASSGDTVSGADLRFSSAAGNTSGTPNGTWQCMGRSRDDGTQVGDEMTSLYLRVA